MAQVVTPVNNDPFDLIGGRNGSIRICTKTNANFNGNTLKLEVKDPGSTDWYDTGISFDKVGAVVMSVPFSGTFRFTTADWTGVAASFLIL